MQTCVLLQTLLARVQEKSNNLEASIATLGEAKQLRGRILKRVQVLHHTRSNLIKYRTLLCRWSSRTPCWNSVNWPPVSVTRYLHTAVN